MCSNSDAWRSLPWILRYKVVLLVAALWEVPVWKWYLIDATKMSYSYNNKTCYACCFIKNCSRGYVRVKREKSVLSNHTLLKYRGICFSPGSFWKYCMTVEVDWVSFFTLPLRAARMIKQPHIPELGSYWCTVGIAIKLQLELQWRGWVKSPQNRSLGVLSI